MQPISPDYNWKNEVKQTKITEENFSQSCIFCVSIAKDKDRIIKLKMYQTIFFIFTIIYLISAKWMWFT